MNKKYENQLYRIIEKGVQERVWQNDGSWTDEQKQLKNMYENHLYMKVLIQQMKQAYTQKAQQKQ